jgi:hypothetical protein
MLRSSRNISSDILPRRLPRRYTTHRLAIHGQQKDYDKHTGTLAQFYCYYYCNYYYFFYCYHHQFFNYPSEYTTFAATATTITGISTLTSSFIVSSTKRRRIISQSPILLLTLELSLYGLYNIDNCPKHQCQPIRLGKRNNWCDSVNVAVQPPPPPLHLAASIYGSSEAIQDEDYNMYLPFRDLKILR